MHNFFCTNISGNTLQLDEKESAHAIRVLRLKEGDTIRVFDGKGKICRAVITRAHPRHTEAEIQTTEEHARRAPWHLHIAIAPTKSIERFEFFLEKVTEIGVDEITPLLCEHSERKNIRHDRLTRVLIAAMKQSMQSFLPKLHPLTPLEELIRKPVAGDFLIAHCCDYHDPSRSHLYDQITTPSITILIGPEGDFSKDEIDTAKQAGFHAVSLGETRLRSETAGMAAATITATKFRNLKEEQ
jgi:16S rRNA (uracil1498-N3)-methyltransferase